MYYSLPGDGEIVERIVHGVKAARRKLSDGCNQEDLVKQISGTIYMEWELQSSSATSEIHPRSTRARESPQESVIDHPYPCNLLGTDLLLLPEADLRVNYVKYLLWNYAGFAWVTKEERDRLRQAELHDRMPSDWDGVDIFARYKSCGIHLGEEGVMTREELEAVLQHPFREYYVYSLSDPKGNVFYVGKGEGKRALSHEKEIYRKKFPIHTNWKKLNRIAQILRSDRTIGYSIDSWHTDATSALVREERLILKYEREAPKRMCNSNGERWRGKPSKALVEVRTQASLPTPEPH